ncbi:P-type ATPase-like protein, partial [Syncephalis pseudoplumigaleata]
LIVSAYRYDRRWLFFYRLACCFTAGIFYLIVRWIPRLWISLVGRPCQLGDAEWVVIENQWKQLSIEMIHRIGYNGKMSNVFYCTKEEAKVALLLWHRCTEDMWLTITDSHRILHTISYFNHRYMRFIYHPRRQLFVQTNAWMDAAWMDLAACRRGISRTEHGERMIVFGPNVVDIESKSILQLMVDEVLHPFYIFQIFSVILWGFDEYYYYAACIVIISAFSIAQTLVETRRNVDRMRRMARFVCDVRVFRDGHWLQLTSEDLVAGDLIDIGNLQTYPCDLLLLSGDCIVNESMLTGESVPVSKVPCEPGALANYDPVASNAAPELVRHFLFGGTKAVRVRPGSGWNNQPVAVAMVMRTGFNSTKGALVRSVLYPRPNRFKFYRDSFRFIGVLSAIAAIGFAASVANFVRLGLTFHRIILRALDLITVVVPPALPATLSIGTNFAIHRMRKANIYCISPPRVNVAGKVNVMCFDKTGTLTEDGLDVLGARPVDRSTGDFELLVEQAKRLHCPPSQEDAAANQHLNLFHALTTCHSLKLVDNELVGDPLDLKMFDFTGWTLEESGMASAGVPRALANNEAPALFGGVVPTVVRPPDTHAMNLSDLIRHTNSTTGEVIDDSMVELGILRCFEFSAPLRRMSVLVKQLGQQCTAAYVKGAPEVMKEICRPDTLPADFDRLLAGYTHRGYRVIACAGKSMDHLSWVKTQRIKREQVESELVFLGFIIFENKLKAPTAGVIETLHGARIRQIMCTGDNVLTAISVSRECGLVRPESQIYVPRLNAGKQAGGSTLSTVIWENVDSPEYRLDPYTLQVLDSRAAPEHAVDRPRFRPHQDYELAITGEVFRWMVDHAPRQVLHRMLVKSPIFARMSPDEKQELVEKLQELGYCVGFCGDGANDCGALRSADVGISLSEEEASVAAPFTSAVTDVRCVIKVIREGRAALVTSFSCFKFMALYSMIQFVTVGLLYSFAYQLADLQYLFIDLFIIMPVAISMGRTGAYPRLSTRRPTASLVSHKVLASIGGQIVVQAAFQLVVYYLTMRQPWYVPPPSPDPDDPNVLCYINSTLFSFSCFQYLFVAAVFSVGAPFRRSMFSNAWFVLSMVALFAISVYLTAFPSPTIRGWMEMMPVPLSFARVLLGLMVALLATTYLVELLIAPKVAQLSKRLKLLIRQWRGLPAKQAVKPYKVALQSFR